MEPAGEFIDNEIERRGESRTSRGDGRGNRRDDRVGFIHKKGQGAMECHREKASGCWMLQINKSFNSV